MLATPAFSGDVLESAVSPIVVKIRASNANDEKIGMAVVVVIGGHGGGAIAHPAQSGLFRHVLKGAIAAIAVEAIRLADRAGLVMGHAIQRTGIDQKKVHQSVAVVIQPAPARAVGFQNVRDF